MATSTEMFQMFHSHVNLCKGWDQIATAANSYFHDILGVSHGLNIDHLQTVLAEQSFTIPDEDRALMEVPLSLDELHNAAKALASNKVPGPNGVPAEFLVINWSTVGSTPAGYCGRYTTRRIYKGIPCFAL
ncbi:unnamed protein product [Calypogeia fissa]